MELGITVERIKAISGQYDLSSIENLDLSKSGIMTVENLEPLTNCKVLNLSHNNIRGLGCLRYLPQLTLLNLSCNRISDLDGVSNIRSLEELHIEGNSIEGFEFLTHLTELPQLRILRLQGPDGSSSNPVCSHPSYFTKVMSMLPNLFMLDGETTMLKKEAQAALLQAAADDINTDIDIGGPELWFSASPSSRGAEAPIADDSKATKRAVAAIHGALGDITDMGEEVDRLLRSLER